MYYRTLSNIEINDKLTLFVDTGSEDWWLEEKGKLIAQGNRSNIPYEYQEDYYTVLLPLDLYQEE